MRDIPIELEEIHKGLRPFARNRHNIPLLIESVGVIPRDNLLVSLEEISQVDLSTLPAQTFPFPQFFILTNITIVCTEDAIYELDNGVLVEKIGSLDSGSTWDVIDFIDFIYLTNGSCCVVRNVATKEFELTTDYPFGTTACNYNGQVLVGSKNIKVPVGGLL